MYANAIQLAGWLVEWDRKAFQLVNGQWHTSMLDQLLPLWRSAEFWAPLYLFLLLFVLTNFKGKGAWWILFFLCTFVACDLTGTYAFKKVFQRPRPCNDPDFYMYTRLLLNKCGGGFSFVSNHATNHFGMGVFSLMTFRPVIGKWAWIFIAWAFSVAWAQVYVGVHYPLDVIAGALLGTLFGISTGSLFNKNHGFPIFGNQSMVSF